MVEHFIKVTKSLGCQYTIKGNPTTPEEVFTKTGVLPGILRRADQLAELIFSSGSIISNSKPEEVIASDCKAYTEGDVTFSVSQIEELGFDNFWKHEPALSEALNAFRESEGLLFSCMLVTDINVQDSVLVFSASDDILDNITYPKAKTNLDHIFELHGIVSRKKQLIPYLTTFLQGIGIGV